MFDFLKRFKILSRKRNERLRQQSPITSTNLTETELKMSKTNLSKDAVTAQQAKEIKDRYYTDINSLTDEDYRILKLFYTGKNEPRDGREPHAIDDMLHYVFSHEQKQISLWHENGRMIELAHNNSAAPKQILRSSLFAPVARGKRKAHQEYQIGKIGDYRMLYTGVQLDQSDNDVLLGLIELINELKDTDCITDITDDKGRQIYTRITTNTNGFLRRIGKPKGKRSRDWLRLSLRRLSGILSIVDSSDSSIDGPIIGKSGFDEVQHVFFADVNHDYIRLFGNDNHTYINLEQRQKLGQKGFAKWLHGFVSTHSGTSTYSMEKLMDLSGSTAKNMSAFKRDVCTPAFDLLLEVGAINEYTVKTYLYKWTRG
jgi:hypothetical protein